MNDKLEITFIGSGNVATHLAQAFSKKGHVINQVYSKSIENAQVLAGLVDADFTNDLRQLAVKSDIYVIAVKDDAIEQVVQEIAINNSLLVHTAGSVTMDVLLKASSNIGVFYPLQTFTKNIPIDFLAVPIGIEANNEKAQLLLLDLAKQIAENVNLIDSKQRKMLHLSAVFACNFTNHMTAIAEQLLIENDIDFELLKPLLQETTTKFLKGNLTKNQTGPAKRRDELVMRQHSELLSNHAIYNEIYNLVSRSIIELDDNK